MEKLELLDVLLGIGLAILLPMGRMLFNQRDDIKTIKAQQNALMLKSSENDTRHAEALTDIKTRLLQAETTQRALMRKVKDFQGYLQRQGMSVRAMEELGEDEERLRL